MTSVQVLLLSLQLFSLVAPSTQHCTHLRIPPANVEHVLLHIDSLNSVEDTGNLVCKSFGVPKFRCGSIKKEVLATMTEMAQLAIRESVVNVSLDRSLAYDVWTHEQVKASEPIVIYPEEPLEDTIAEYCTRFKIENDTCENAASTIGDFVARDWGCDDSESNEHEEKRFMEIPFLLDQQNHHIKVDVSTDGTVDAAKFCLEKQINVAECAALIRIVREQIQGLHANRVDEDNDEKKRDRDGSAVVERKLRINSPIDTRLYPRSERIYIKVDWEWGDKGLDEKIAPEEVCLKFGYSSSPVKCFMVPQTDPLFINQNANEGSHILYFTDKSGEQILAVTTFQVVVPTVDLIDIFTSKAEGSDSEHLMATIRTTLFDPFDPAFRVCVLLDDSLGCLDPEWMAVDERELRHATHKEPLHQSVTFRSPLDHVPFNHGNGHEISVLLLTANNKAVHLTTTLAFNAASTVNPLEGTSILHILDPRIHTPQRPRSCPDSMRSTPNLRWICELWRHEWGIYSQNGEDGILSKIFHHIGTKDKSYVEFGTESGQECNTRLLRQIHGWKGLLMDSRYEEESIELHREFITRENFMPLLTEKYQHLVPPDLDLLSIDVDFNDFWLLSAVDLTRVAPRVVVVEVNSHIPSSEARTVQYDDSDDGSGGWDGLSAYFGGSVAAFHRWGARNGYSLVYCESHGVNCFLVRNDALGGVNVSAVLGPDQLQNPPNFFGQGWNYPDMWKPHHKWVWI